MTRAQGAYVVKTTVNIEVFVRFHFFLESVFFFVLGPLFYVILRAFGRLRAPCYWFLRGPENTQKFDRILETKMKK